eukprot:TRINITY_DN32753_c0_g1_i1.p1 TRINITY_DN32753_c0_g1~~TRINITY_DN32753_c0_g1_i1.p1  ORF type:complete len:317 (+),score=69.07 TRINITY_DN32753_c0_g1_i1:65-952(+)
MGAGASADAVKSASEDDLKVALAGLSAEERARISAALGASEKPASEKKASGDAPASEESPWTTAFVALVEADLKDPSTSLPLVCAHMADEVKADGVPRSAVLGQPTFAGESEVEKAWKNKCHWYQMYDNKEAATDEKRTAASTEWVTNTIKEHCANNDALKDIVCPYIGTCYYLGKPGEASGNAFYMLGSFPCKDAEGAQKAVDILKAHGVKTMAEEGAIGMIIIPPSAIDSICPEEKDDKRVQYFKSFKTKDDFDKHLEAPYFKEDLKGKLVELIADFNCCYRVWFGDAKNVAP